MNQVVESRGKKNKSEKLIDTNRNSVSVELVHSLLTSANFLSNYPRVDQKMEIAAILVDWNETENGKKKKKTSCVPLHMVSLHAKSPYPINI